MRGGRTSGRAGKGVISAARHTAGDKAWERNCARDTYRCSIPWWEDSLCAHQHFRLAVLPPLLATAPHACTLATPRLDAPSSAVVPCAGDSRL